MNKAVNKQKGIVRLIIIVVIGIIILSYFGINSQAVVENKFVQFLIELFKNFWR